jgi:predicted  nucleic acid-binding Zn-ribbon protein
MLSYAKGDEEISDIQIISPGVFKIYIEALLEKKSILILSSDKPGKYSIKL